MTQHSNKKRTRTSFIHYTTLILLGIFLSVGTWNVYKPLPEGLSSEGGIHTVNNEDVIFLSDETFFSEGERKSSQKIFDYVLSMIDKADSLIVVDMFLWNSFGDDTNTPHRKLSQELSNALINKKNSNPKVTIVVISDPINTSYGGHEALHFKTMKDAGIKVVFTNLPLLRDSNPVYSMFWRTIVFPFDVVHERLFGKSYTFRPLPSILGAGENVTLRSYLQLLNFKANHRKLIVADELSGSGVRNVVSLVTSANPHNGSSAHSNVALVVKKEIWKDIIASESSVTKMSSSLEIDGVKDVEKNEGGSVVVQLVTEGAIRNKVLTMLSSANEGDTIQLFMFYLSDTRIVKELKEAAKRGVTLSIILDPNKDAFGREKNGVPNRSVAAELLNENSGKVTVRWCKTNGEQCHTKLMIVSSKGEQSMLLGSANYTRRNIGDYNLESNIYVKGKNVQAIKDGEDYFKRAWTNENDKIYTTEYETFEDTSLLHQFMWRVMETTGLGTF